MLLFVRQETWEVQAKHKIGTRWYFLSLVFCTYREFQALRVWLQNFHLGILFQKMSNHRCILKENINSLLNLRKFWERSPPHKYMPLTTLLKVVPSYPKRALSLVKPVHSCLKFSHVFGQISSKSSITTIDGTTWPVQTLIWTYDRPGVLLINSLYACYAACL